MEGCGTASIGHRPAGKQHMEETRARTSQSPEFPDYPQPGHQYCPAPSSQEVPLEASAHGPHLEDKHFRITLYVPGQSF